MARPEQVDVQVGLDVGKESVTVPAETATGRVIAGLAMLTTRQPCQPARSTHRREIADAA